MIKVRQVIFAECTTHGTLPWVGAGERRTVCYRCTPRTNQPNTDTASSASSPSPSSADTAVLCTSDDLWLGPLRTDTPKHTHFAGGVFTTELPEWVSELTPAQQAVLEPPYIYHHPARPASSPSHCLRTTFKHSRRWRKDRAAERGAVLLGS